MLVLSRHKNEAIVIVVPKGYKGITEDVKIDIMCVEIRGDKVRTGIAAPKEILVHRQEVFDAIKRQEKHEQTEFIPTPSKKDKEKYYGSDSQS